MVCSRVLVTGRRNPEKGKGNLVKGNQDYKEFKIFYGC